MVRWMNEGVSSEDEEELGTGDQNESEGID